MNVNETIKVSDYIAAYLVEKGITNGFTVTGGGAMHLNYSFGHQTGLKMLYNHHEQACAIAAESYARITGRPALVCVTTGPGGINALNGVAGAYLDSIPMLVISGQVRYDTTARSTGLDLRAMGDQEFDICKAVASMTKYCEMVIDPKRVKYAIDRVLAIASEGRPGPVWLDIPLNVQGAYVAVEDLEAYRPEAAEVIASAEEEKPEFAGTQEAIAPETVDAILTKLSAAARPVLYPGNGVRIADAKAELDEFTDLTGIPVVTCWDGIDVIETDHPCYVGRGGIMGDRPGNFAVQNSDVLFAFGNRLSIRQVGYNHASWARASYVIMNDIDPAELAKPTLHVDLPVCADVRKLLQALNARLRAEGGMHFAVSEAVGAWKKQCQTWKEKYPVVLPRHYEDDSPVNVYALIQELSRRLPENRITVVGNGSACVVGSAAYMIRKGQRFVINSAIASMGYDLPAAIGAWVAAKGDEIVCISGDGSLQMNLQELQTIIHHRMGVKLFVINNSGYHSIRQTQTNFFGNDPVGIGPDSQDLSFPDLGKLAAAYGYPYVKIDHRAQLLDRTLDDVLAQEGPVICEIFVTKEQKFEPKSATKRLEDGSLVSAPLEDLAPFLSEEELKANMYIPLMEK